MAFQVFLKNGIHHVKGNLINKNSNLLRLHCEAFLEQNEHIILSLDLVKSVDQLAIENLTLLYANAIANNKILSIIGRENKAIFNRFKLNKRNYIFNNDYV